MLNAEQKRAAEATEGPLLILAGAGAGKTKTIVERVRALVRQGVAPSTILAITFTNKAAREMRERVERVLSEDPVINRPISSAERPFVSTFHSLGVHILRAHGHLLGLPRRFAIFDKDDSKKALKEALTARNLDPKAHDPNKILGIISREKGRGTSVDEYLANSDARGYVAELVAEVWPEYEKILKRDQALDFDDLLLKTLKLLREHREAREYYQKTWKYIHIDEYQDTNRVQYEISKLLVGDEHHICAVGDIDQNIYSWRGAELKNILAFEKDYPEALIVTLEENYRSTKTILGAANAVIEKNKVRRPKNLFTSNALGDKILIRGSLDEIGEAEYIALTAEELIKRGGVGPEEIAVLYRANFQSRVLEEAFMHRGVPYQILGLRFFERREVKDIISYLRAALNPQSLADLKRIVNVPARGVGKASIAKIFSGDSSLPPAMKAKVAAFYALLEEIRKCAEGKPLSETIAFIIKTSGLEAGWKEGADDGAERLANAYELVSFAARYDLLPPAEATEAFLTDAALQSDQDELREEVPAVRLMTVHAAKGLEFDAVFIAGLEEGLFPHERINEDRLTPEEAEEERRLFYVALTRARKRVFLSYAQLRSIYGRQRVNMPSQFILDIPPELSEEESWNDTGVAPGRKPLLDIDF